MKIIITDKCIGCGACATINGDMFDIEYNRAHVNTLHLNKNENDCFDAVIYCPVNAIKIIE